MRLWNYAVKVAHLYAAAAFYTDTMGGELRLSGRVFGCDYRVLRLGGTRLLLFTKAPYEDLLDRAAASRIPARRVRGGRFRCRSRPGARASPERRAERD